MSDKLTEVQKFMCRFFGIFGAKATVNSHEPHAVLSQLKEGFKEAKREELVTVEPYNLYGSITIRCTEKGAKVAADAYRILHEAEMEKDAGRAAISREDGER